MIKKSECRAVPGKHLVLASTIVAVAISLTVFARGKDVASGAAPTRNDSRIDGGSKQAVLPDGTAAPSGAADGQEAPAELTDKARGDLKVMTWNIQGRHFNLGRVLTWIQKRHTAESPLDVIALQEVSRAQARDLAGGLGGFVAHYFEMTQVKDGIEYGIAILSRHRFGGSEKPYDLPRCETETEKRKLISVTIRVQGRLVHIYNTHLHSRRFCQGGDRPPYEGRCKDAPTRAAQAARVMDLIRGESERASEKFRPILMGDFNTLEGTSPYNRVRNYFAGYGFADAWKEVNCPRRRDCPTPSCGDPSSSGYTWSNQRIDYIFVGSGSWKAFDIRWARVFHDSPRPNPDHFPVVASLNFE